MNGFDYGMNHRSIMKNKIRLGVNIDHLATLRQARGTDYPDIVDLAKKAQKFGADQITLHLREDRRHIQDSDLPKIRKVIKCMNLEMALSEEMIKIALKIKPDWVCLVPEKRAELTTEGGLDVVKNLINITKAINIFHKNKIKVSLFISADPKQCAAGVAVGADAVEFHTGKYAELFLQKDKKIKCQEELKNIKLCAKLISAKNIRAHAGHGLTTKNVLAIAKIPEITELNIGHAIVCDALICGWELAIKNMIYAYSKIKK